MLPFVGGSLSYESTSNTGFDIISKTSVFPYHQQEGGLVTLDPKFTINRIDLGREGSRVSELIKRLGHNPTVTMINLPDYSMSLDKSVEFIKFLSRCKHLTHIDMSNNILDTSAQHLAKSIRSWGDKPALQVLCLYNCSLTATASLELVQSLSSCRHLTVLNLGENKLGKAGHQLAQSIRSWGDNPPLQDLDLRNCSLSVTASLELVQSLSSCRHLTVLDLRGNKLGEAGHLLAQSIRSWGDEPPLQELQLYNCSLTATASLELVQSLSSCRHLTALDLGQNKLGEAGHQLTQSIRSWGDEPPLQELQLYNCSLTATTSLELVQSLSSCRHLTVLDLRGNKLGEAGHQLAQSIRSWGDEPPLQELQLYNCSLTATASLELVQSLSSCRHLTALNLVENKLGEAGHQLAQSIRSWGDEPPLQELQLYNCSLTATTSLELVQSLSSCRHLTVLDLRGTKLGEAGHQLAQSIRSWGDKPPLQQLYLYNCSLPATASLELVQSLSSCRHLTLLDSGQNKLGEAGHQLAQSIKSWGDEPPLQKLYLHNCSLSATTSLELVQSLSSCRHLTVLNLGENKLGEAGHQLAQSIRSWGDEPPLQQLWLHNSSLTATASIELVQSLSSCRHLTALNLRENKLGEAGHQLAQSIRSWGDEPPLQKLQLYNCSLTATASLELVQSLSSCRHLTLLNLGENKLGEAGHQLAQSIRSWGDEPPLQKLYLQNCSPTASATLQLVQSLSTCRYLIELNLRENKLGEAGQQLAQSISSWGDEPPLQELQLYNCSLTATTSLELLQSLSSCRHLTVLDLGQNKIGEAGHQLPQSIIYWGDEPPLQKLWLHNSSLTATASIELVQSLSSCRHLTALNLGENKLGEAGHQLAQSIRSWGDEPPLQQLWLHNSSLTATASIELVQSLSSCRHLTVLNLWGNKLGETGHQLAQSIRSWGDKPPLQQLYLYNCSISATASIELVQSLSSCRHLTALNLGENKLGEAGHQLAQLIRSWGDEPPLQKLQLYNCSLTATASHELVQSLSSCRHLTLLNLGQNKLGEAGHQLAQSIKSWGDEPPLQKLYLHNCSLSATASLELVQSLSSCRHLTVLDLGENKLGEAGHQLAQSIRSWGDEPPLQQLWLHNSSLSATASIELVQSLSSCRHLTALNLGENKLGEAGHQLAQSIRSWGDEPHLQKLYLYNCSLPATASLELVQSLSSCRHLTLLNLGENKLGEAGHQLAQSIKSWGDEPPLQKLYLYNCSLPATASLELVQSLSSCRHLTLLNLRENKLGEAGHQLAQSIKSWGDEPPLQKLYLYNCSLSATASLELVKSLSSCRHLTVLNLGENKLGEAGHQLAQSIRSWGDEPPLQELQLYNCSLTATASLELVQSLSSCRHLTALNLVENKLGEAGHQLAQSIISWGDEPPLQELQLCNCLLTATASLELVQSLSSCRHLTVLDLGQNKLGEAGHQLAQSIKSWGDEPPLQKLYLHNCSLSATASLELVQSLSACRHLTVLNLGENKLGEAGHQLAQSIRSWVDEPPLQELQLYNCSLTATASLELVQSLSSCRHLTALNLGENKLGEAGHQLAQSIRSWGDESLLQELHLYNCSLPSTASLGLVQSLSSCKYLTVLDLGENKLGEAGHQLAQSIRSWGDEPPLQKLQLYNCSLTATASLELVQSLSSCRHLTALNLGENKLGEAGHQLAQSIRSWGDEPPLQKLYLQNCSPTASATLQLVQSLSTCRYLIELNLRENKLGEAGQQLAQSIRSWGDNPSLLKLHLHNCSMLVKVTEELLKSLSTCKDLTHLDLGRNTLKTAGHHLVTLIRSLGDSSQLQELNIRNCKMPMDICSSLLQALSTSKRLTILDLSKNKLGEAGYHLVQSIRCWGNDPPLRKLYLTDTAVPMDIWNDILESLKVCRRLKFLDIPDVLDETGYCLQIRGPRHDEKLQESEVRTIFFTKYLNSEYLKRTLNFFSKA